MTLIAREFPSSYRAKSMGTSRTTLIAQLLLASYCSVAFYAKQVSEEVERALAKIGPARQIGR